MRYSDPYIVTAGEREAGTVCTGCGLEVQQGDRSATCRTCGAIHHEHCWHLQEGCRSYNCSASNRSANSKAQVLSISRDELASTEPLPTRVNPFGDDGDYEVRVPEKRWNRTAIWAFVISLLGIPLFGIVTGLVAMIVGCIALVSQTGEKRGMWMGVAGILIGLADVVGWAFGLHHFLGDNNHTFVAMQEFAAPDLASLDKLPKHLNRAMRANVIVKSNAGFAKQGMGSGVILRVHEGLAWIVTNRHVIDHDYTDSTKSAADDLSKLSDVSIQTVSEFDVPARIEWVAPHGVDLAILSSRLDSDGIAIAHWDEDEVPKVGEGVFAVGNPHGLGWTLSDGQISQVRRQHRGMFDYRVLQISAALNPGNSGGGLYDQAGRLIGINTLTGDKRFAEGLGFSIAFPTLLELLPKSLALPRKSPQE